MRNILILLVSIMVAYNPLFANNNPTDPKTDQDPEVTIMPKVFQLGENEAAYDQLSVEYGTSLFALEDVEATQAMSIWSNMIKEMEAHAEMLDYDIKGVKMWLHVFWDEDGRINHIGYYLKPASRNVDKDELTSFLMDFVNNYYVPVSYSKKFSHNSHAAFPTLNWMEKNKLATKGKE